MLICTRYMYASYVTGRFTVVTISNCLTCDRKVYRGMSGVKLPECFMIAKEGGGKGGVDFGFVSTSTDRTVATSYLGGKEMPSTHSQTCDALLRYVLR